MKQDTSKRESRGAFISRCRADAMDKRVMGDASLGVSIANELSSAPASSLVEPLQFPGSGAVFYRYALRPSYGVTVSLVRTRESAAEAMRYYGIDNTIAESAAGFTTDCVNGNMVIGVITGGVGTLAHEAAHVALRVLRKATRNGDEERLAWMVGDLVDAFCSLV